MLLYIEKKKMLDREIDFNKIIKKNDVEFYLKKFFFRITDKYDIEFIKIKDLYKKIFYTDYFKKVYKNIELDQEKKDILNIKCIKYDHENKTLLLL